MFETGERCIDRRRAGVLLHITSLPGLTATGDFGSAAKHFVDFLQSAGFSVWQTLPVGPTQTDGSPYQSSSVHAGNPRLISLEPLVARGWLDVEILEQGAVSDKHKRAALYAAWEKFNQDASKEASLALSSFIAEHHFWLQDYTLFQALHEEHQCGWWEWPEQLRHREPLAMAQGRARLASKIDYLCFEQFLFFSQWLELKQYANERGIELFGDLPIFVAHDSAEVWANQEMFYLDETGQPSVVAGVPPDCFSELGQRWGNPIYRWDQMQEDGFTFWVDRMKTQLHMFDLIRIDHFRGFESYWEIPAEEEHAIRGRWVKAPGDELFKRLYEVYGSLPLVAEDLGIITPEVKAMREKYRLPGMKILQFAFSGDPDNPYLPYNQSTNAVVYTGTHDNDTSLGWYLSLNTEGRRYVDEYLGRSREIMPWPLIRCALASRARLAILPMQDILALDGRHRMNLPGTTEGNWNWRFSWDQIEPDLADRLRRRVEMYGRLR
ncbi:4-alpha-glucanotransferase (amylomaltase) [hydrothermal vent metagenome]|uniref:4-alpha-glucanotransferase n=1 Tax=hydrothermal vent metagenome TaxID=652676 RepID=A0A3B1B4G5_9ZZZZ